MTDRQMKLIRKQLPARTQVPWREWTEEQKQIDRELDCVSMINSILAYDWFGQSAEEIMVHEENAYYNYLADYVKLFGRANVVALIQEQMNDIKDIKRNVSTDSEGLSYNAIVWIDD